MTHICCVGFIHFYTLALSNYLCAVLYLIIVRVHNASVYGGNVPKNILPNIYNLQQDSRESLRGILNFLQRC